MKEWILYFHLVTVEPALQKVLFTASRDDLDLSFKHMFNLFII